MPLCTDGVVVEFTRNHEPGCQILGSSEVGDCAYLVKIGEPGGRGPRIRGHDRGAIGEQALDPFAHGFGPQTGLGVGFRLLRMVLDLRQV